MLLSSKSARPSWFGGLDFSSMFTSTTDKGVVASMNSEELAALISGAYSTRFPLPFFYLLHTSLIFIV